MNQARRVLRLLRQLEASSPRRFSLRKLAQEYGVCEQTMRRDFQVLEEAGVAVKHTPDSDDGPIGFWWI